MRRDAEGQGLAGDELAVVGGHFEPLDLHRVGFGAVAEGAGHPQGAVGEEVPQRPLAAGRQPQELLGRSASPNRKSPGRGAVLDGVGVEAEGAAGRHRVEAVVVAEVVQRADLVEVEDLEVRAEEADVLVVELGLVAFVVVDRDAAAHRAVRTAVGGDPGLVRGARRRSSRRRGGWVLRKLCTGRPATSLHQARTPFVLWMDQPGLLVDLVDLLEVAGADGLHRRRDRPGGWAWCP